MGKLTADFKGDVAIVTGAGAGIGLAIASALAEAGAQVHAFDVRLPESAPESLHFHELDVTDGAAVDAAVASVVASAGRVDLLVNNAGITRDMPLWKMGENEWQAVIDVNLGGPYRLLHAVAPHMREARRGRIVQIASINGLRGKFGQANYSASKGGLIALTRTAARELGGRGITVNAVAPGLIETAMTRNLPEEILAKAIAETALGRAGQTGNIVDAVLFLLSEQAAHITGEVVRVDGGQMA